MKRGFATTIIGLAAVIATGFEWSDDPSIRAVAKDDIHSGERFRMLADFNSDGIQDMALSCDMRSFGNAGGQFTLYLGNATGKYRKYGEFFAHTMAVSLEKIGTQVRLWTYCRLGGWIGQIGYYEVFEDTLSEYHSITIHPGDSGSKMGNAIYEAVIKSSDLPITVERSVTKNGVVKWIDPNRAIDGDEE
ncbi:hypothetical protein JXA88_02735 [Candidatus Fermentibacteria bacterium]|nr:hypothetical protein [Candidatus Fermentibacteria bacterium]